MRITYINLTFLSLITCVLFVGCGTNKDTPSNSTESSLSETPKAKRSIAQKLRDNDHLPIETRISIYNQLKKDSLEAYNFSNEDEMTMYGYSFLWDENTKEAIEVFKLIVEHFPNSSNPYDSLGEGYMWNGDTELAIDNYEKSLELNPENFNAEDMIEQMKFPDRIPETPAEKFVKTLKPEEYKADLDQLGKTLKEVHPNATKFISEETFWQNIEDKKSLITEETTYAEFMWHCSEIIASVNCSHTGMGRFNPEHEMLPTALRFPLQTRWIDGHLFVTDPLNNAKEVVQKEEITSINGTPVSMIIQDIYKHIPSQGYIETSKRHDFNNWSTGLIPYALDFPKTYEIEIEGKQDPIVLNEAISFNDPVFDEPINGCGEPLCLEILDDKKSAVLSVLSFNFYPWNNLDKFEKFMDESFDEINKKGIENLVIDVRFNGGGSPESAFYLLKYLVDEPFTYSSTADYDGKESKSDLERSTDPFENNFQGKLYFIIDGHGNSTTGHFMSLVKVLDLGVIVGEELGSNQFCNAGQAIRRLSHTKMQYYVANNTHETTATSLPDETGILPDHTVVQSLDDYLNQVDTVKEYTLELLKNQ